jgi:hypothetical protein
MTPNVSHEEQLSQLDALDRIARLPDSSFLTTSEAAVFLRSSVSALETWRTKGGGPTYSQQGARGVGGVNQKCLYEKADLLAWQRAAKVSSTMEAAVRKGQLFTTVLDLAQAEAFWIDGRGRVLGMVEAAPISTVIDRLGVVEIAWLPAIDAAAREWSDLGAHRSFADQMTSVLNREARRVAAGVDATDIAESAHAPASSGRTIAMDGAIPHA